MADTTTRIYCNLIEFSIFLSPVFTFAKSKTCRGCLTSINFLSVKYYLNKSPMSTVVKSQKTFRLKLNKIRNTSWASPNYYKTDKGNKLTNQATQFFQKCLINNPFRRFCFKRPKCFRFKKIVWLNYETKLNLVCKAILMLIKIRSGARNKVTINFF